MRIVSLRTRLLAAVVDAAIVMPGVAAVGGLGVAAVVAYRHVRGDHEKDQEPDRMEGFGFLESRAASAATAGVAAALGVAGRNWRSPGYRVVGLRRVDARTGGPVSVRSALKGLLFDQSLQRTMGMLFRSRTRRWEGLQRTLEPQLQEIKRKHAGDSQARQRAVRELYEANGVNSGGCVRDIVARGAVVQIILALGARDGRTVRDRVTGTVVISVPRR